MKTITYDSNGIISSLDDNIDNNLNDTLNLNCAFVGLPDLRKTALTALQQEINSRYPDRSVPKAYFLKLLEKFQNENEVKRPYVGLLIYWLKKKVGERG